MFAIAVTLADTNNGIKWVYAGKNIIHSSHDGQKREFTYKSKCTKCYSDEYFHNYLLMCTYRQRFMIYDYRRV